MRKMTAWRKASASSGQSSCVECSTDGNNVYAIRDTKLGEDSPQIWMSKSDFHALGQYFAQ